jgi:hypothetical protein
MLVVCALNRYARRLRLEINQLTDGGMPPAYDSMR